MKKIVLTNIRETLHVLQCRRWFKCQESSASSALKTEKSLMLQVLKF